MFCLNKTLSDTFLKKLQTGEINPEKLAEMSSKERRDFFGFLGEQNAVKVNELFETKLLLKNQQRGMITWAKQVAGLKPEAKRDIVDRVNKMENILEPETQQEFLEDLAAHKMGVTITMEEAGHISELAKLTADKKTIMEKSERRKGFTPTKEEIKYGRAGVAFGNYINDLKIEAKKKTVSEHMKAVQKNPAKAIYDATIGTAGVAKAVKAALDLSYTFRQGLRMLFTNPKIWKRNAILGADVAIKAFGGKPVMDEINASIISHPLYGEMKIADLAVAKIEEDIPTSIQEEIKVIGKFFKASDNAFTAQAHMSRVDAFAHYYQIAEKNGVDVTDKAELKAIGKLVNTLTGRSSIGKWEPQADILNVGFFAPRLFVSHIDTITQPALGRTKFQRQQASINLVKIIGGITMVLAIADALDDEAVDWDPRSANFGKIKVGNTRFDVTGGMSSLAVFAARMISGESKSSTSGIITEINSGDFGSKTKMDVSVDFMKNKFSPAFSTGLHVFEGKTFEGDEPTVWSELENMFVPLPITNVKESLDDPASAPLLWTVIADGLGIGTNTYGLNVNWEQKDTEEMNQAKEQLGDKFEEANDKFNKDYNDWFNTLANNQKYIDLSNDDKKKTLSSKREDIKDDVLREYGFRYRKPQVKRLPKF